MSTKPDIRFRIEYDGTGAGWTPMQGLGFPDSEAAEAWLSGNRQTGVAYRIVPAPSARIAELEAEVSALKSAVSRGPELALLWENSVLMYGVIPVGEVVWMQGNKPYRAITQKDERCSQHSGGKEAHEAVWDRAVALLGMDKPAPAASHCEGIQTRDCPNDPVARCFHCTDRLCLRCLTDHECAALPDEPRAPVCICTKVCDCQSPPTHMSQECPVHMENPAPNPECPVHVAPAVPETGGERTGEACPKSPDGKHVIAPPKEGVHPWCVACRFHVFPPAPAGSFPKEGTKANSVEMFTHPCSEGRISCPKCLDEVNRLNKNAYKQGRSDERSTKLAPDDVVVRADERTRERDRIVAGLIALKSPSHDVFAVDINQAVAIVHGSPPLPIPVVLNAHPAGPTTVQDSNWRRCCESRETFDAFIEAIQETEREQCTARPMPAGGRNTPEAAQEKCPSERDGHQCGQWLGHGGRHGVWQADIWWGVDKPAPAIDAIRAEERAKGAAGERGRLRPFVMHVAARRCRCFRNNVDAVAVGGKCLSCQARAEVFPKGTAPAVSLDECTVPADAIQRGGLSAAPSVSPQEGRAPKEVVCAHCDDTHMVEMETQRVMCTHCPVPCRKCGWHKFGGAFCMDTPCGCDCHKGASKPAVPSSPVVVTVAEPKNHHTFPNHITRDGVGIWHEPKAAPVVGAPTACDECRRSNHSDCIIFTSQDPVAESCACNEEGHHPSKPAAEAKPVRAGQVRLCDTFNIIVTGMDSDGSWTAKGPDGVPNYWLTAELLAMPLVSDSPPSDAEIAEAAKSVPVEPGPRWLTGVKPAAIERRAKSVVRLNAEVDPAYCPYCMRCPGLVRMQKVEAFYWQHHCGAEHDEREPAPVAPSPVEPLTLAAIDRLYPGGVDTDRNDDCPVREWRCSTRMLRVYTDSRAPRTLPVWSRWDEGDGDRSRSAGPHPCRPRPRDGLAERKELGLPALRPSASAPLVQGVDLRRALRGEADARAAGGELPLLKRGRRGAQARPRLDRNRRAGRRTQPQRRQEADEQPAQCGGHCCS